MTSWRPQDITPLDEIREARAALADGQKHIQAAYGPVGLVRLSELSGGNSLALRLLHDAIGYKTDRVHKRVARSAATAALRVLDGLTVDHQGAVSTAVRETSQDPVGKNAIRQPSASKPTSGSAALESQEKDSYWRTHPAAKPKAGSARSRPAIQSEDISIGDTSAGKYLVANSESDQEEPMSRAMGTEIRRFTAEGIERAKQFLAHVRENPSASAYRVPSRELLFGERYSRPFEESVRVEPRTFRTRRDAAEYFAPKLAPIRHLAVDNARLWSWLGMYYFAKTVKVDGDKMRLSPVDETFVVEHKERRSYLLRYRHYLWGAWRLYENHGESVGFLLDQELISFGDIAERSLGSIRLFNSTGIIQLIIRLYTHGNQQKRGFNRSSGGLRHLIRVLDQLERTYDVYGMSPEALIKVLPEEFKRWDSQSATSALNSAASQEPAASIAKEPVGDDSESPPDRRWPWQPQGSRGQTAAEEASRSEADSSDRDGDHERSLRADFHTLAPGGLPDPMSLSPEQIDPDPRPNPQRRRALITPPSDPDADHALRAASEESSPAPQTVPVERALKDVRAKIERQGQVSWADPREHLDEGSEAWDAYVAVCGVPERRLFRTAFLHRLNEVLASLD